MVSCSKGHDKRARGAVFGPLASAPPSAAESKFLSLSRAGATALGDRTPEAGGFRLSGVGREGSLERSPVLTGPWPRTTLHGLGSV